MQSLKACARLPALADIAAWRSQSVASWLNVFAGMLLVVFWEELAGAVRLLAGRDGWGDWEVAHAATSINAAKSPSFMGHLSPWSGSLKNPP